MSIEFRPAFNKPQIYLRANTPTGKGSTNTNILRGFAVVSSGGDGISLISDNTNGDHIAISRDGIYSISFIARAATAGLMGIKIGSKTNILVDSALRAHHGIGVAGGNASRRNASWTGHINSSEVIYFYLGPATAGAGSENTIEITRIA